jgi:hypothetical protein
MKILRKRILKIVPVWLIIAILLSTGIAFAAFSWISNQLYNTVSVTATPLTLVGSFPSSFYQDVPVDTIFNYTVNSGTPTGYIWVRLTGSFSSEANLVNAYGCWVNQTGDITPAFGTNYPLYPKYTANGASSTLDYLWLNNTSGNPFAFGSSGGKIMLGFGFNRTITSLQYTIRVTSTVP